MRGRPGDEEEWEHSAGILARGRSASKKNFDPSVPISAPESRQRASASARTRAMTSPFLPKPIAFKTAISVVRSRIAMAMAFPGDEDRARRGRRGEIQRIIPFGGRRTSRKTSRRTPPRFESGSACRSSHRPRRSCPSTASASPSADLHLATTTPGVVRSASSRGDLGLELLVEEVPVEEAHPHGRGSPVGVVDPDGRSGSGRPDRCRPSMGAGRRPSDLAILGELPADHGTRSSRTSRNAFACSGVIRSSRRRRPRSFRGSTPN